MESIQDKNGCYCKKCNALVDQTDEKCPNGHILDEVGRSFVVSAEAKAVVSAEAEIDVTKDK